MNLFKSCFLVSALSLIMVLSVTYTHGQKSILTETTIDVSQTSFSAGANASICNDSEFVTRGICKSQVLTMWQSSGDGIFENSNDLITTYTAGEQDIYNGSVTLTLVLFPMGGSGSEVIYDDMILYLGICRSDSQLD